MANTRDLRPNFEAILGETLDPDVEQDVALRSTTGTRLTEHNRHVTSRYIGSTGESGKACARHTILDITGSVRTRADGSIQFLLSDFYCPNADQAAHAHPINFVATPHSRFPRYVTAHAALLNSRRDVQLTVHAWEQTGQPAADTTVHWRCLVPFAGPPSVD